MVVHWVSVLTLNNKLLFVSVIDNVLFVSVIGRYHSLFSGLRYPVMISLLLCWMETLFLVNTAVQSLSYNTPMDRRELVVNPGNICACLTATGSEDKWSCLPWDDRKTFPLGRVTWIGRYLSQRGRAGVSGVM